MAIPITATSLLETTLIGKQDGQTTLNVFHWRCTSPPSAGECTQGELETLVQLFVDDFWAGGWKGVANTGFTLEGCRVQIIRPSRYVGTVLVVGEAGLANVGELPSGAALVLRRLTQLAGKANRGRVYLCGIDRQYMANSLWVEGDLTDATNQMIAAMTNPISTTATGTFSPIIWSEASGGNIARYIVSGLQDPIVRYQRRREVGRGI